MPSPTRTSPDAGRFDLLLFSADPRLVGDAVRGGAAAIVVDWERRGKAERQAGRDTQINEDTCDDLRRVRAATSACVICRINPFGPTSDEEISAAVDAGADELLLPMLRSGREVERALTMLDGRCRLSAMLETVAAIEEIDALARQPLARIYVGLNDLSIQMRTPNIFTVVADGTLERILERISAPFGFGGLTLPDRGHPIPCRLIMGEMARLGCSFSVLRRSFHRDLGEIGATAAVQRIAAGMAAAFRRSREEVERDHREFQGHVAAWTIR